MVRRASVIAALVLSLTGAVALAVPNSPLHANFLAQTPNGQTPGEQPRPKRERGDWLRDLNLSADQQQKLKQVRERYKDQMSQQRQAVRKAQTELKDLMAGTASTDEVRQKYNQLKTLRQQLEDNRFESMLAMREILTPEQRQKLAQKMASHRDGFRDRMKQRMSGQEPQ